MRMRMVVGVFMSVVMRMVVMGIVDMLVNMRMLMAVIVRMGVASPAQTLVEHPAADCYDGEPGNRS